MDSEQEAAEQRPARTMAARRNDWRRSTGADRNISPAVSRYSIVGVTGGSRSPRGHSDPHPHPRPLSLTGEGRRLPSPPTLSLTGEGDPHPRPLSLTGEGGRLP